MGVGYAVFSGTDPERGPYVNQLVSGNNGGPGSPTADGWITYAMPDCAKTVYIDSFEVLEQKYPIRFRSDRLLDGHGRARAHPRRPGERDRLRPDEGGRCRRSTSPTSRSTRPQGVLGGGPAALAGAAGSSADGQRGRARADRRLRARAGGVDRRAGERRRAATATRSSATPRRSAHDVLEGWVSRERAEADYGVIFDGEASDESLAVNVAQTSARREALRGDRDEGRPRPEKDFGTERRHAMRRLYACAAALALTVGMAACGSGSGSSGDSTSADSNDPITLGFAIGETGFMEPFDGRRRPRPSSRSRTSTATAASTGASSRPRPRTRSRSPSSPATRRPRCSTTAPTSSSPAVTSTRARPPRSSPRRQGMLAFSTCAASTAFGPAGHRPARVHDGDRRLRPRARRWPSGPIREKG